MSNTHLSDKNKNSDKPEAPRSDDEKIDEAGKESFPASDPPAWNNGEEDKD